MHSVADELSSRACPAGLPDERDIAVYEARGWYVSKPVLPHDLIDGAAEAAVRYYRGERDTPLPISEGYLDWKPGDGDGIRNNEFVSLQSTGIRALALHPVIGAIAAALARTTEIRLLDDQLIYKPPNDPDGRTATGWHADKAYWGTCSSERLLTAWIPFHDCSAEQSPLVMIDGSHKWPEVAHMRHFNNCDLDRIEDRLAARGRMIIKSPMILKKGQISFHNAGTLHAAFPNRSDRPRLSLAVHLQNRSNRYQPARAVDGKPIQIFNERLARRLPSGEPDLRDPQVFPVIWPPGNTDGPKQP